MSKAPRDSGKKTDRQEKLAAALRANLQRRKAAKQESRKAAIRAAKKPSSEDADNG
ncbi:MAG: hypothetical protein ACON4V_03075 [Parvibaculales bacterium]